MNKRLVLSIVLMLSIFVSVLSISASVAHADDGDNYSNIPDCLPGHCGGSNPTPAQCSANPYLPGCPADQCSTNPMACLPPPLPPINPNPSTGDCNAHPDWPACQTPNVPTPYIPNPLPPSTDPIPPIHSPYFNDDGSIYYNPWLNPDGSINWNFDGGGLSWDQQVYFLIQALGYSPF